MNKDDIFSCFPSRISAEKTLSLQYNSDNYFRFFKYQFSVVAYLATTANQDFSRHRTLLKWS